MIYCRRQKVTGRIDTELQIALNKEQDYWQKVLKRIVEVIKFLASRGLPLRGDNEKIGSVQNGNYLGILELLGQFDPFLQEHINKYGNAGKGTPSYLSATICEEFIEIMGKKVLEAIVSEINAAKYYSISVDSTADISHIDQLTFIVRYLKAGVVIERFLQFIPIRGHGAEYLAEVVITFLRKHRIPLKNCRGQSYDNASNMAGKYSGLQTRIKKESECAEFVPCAGHSLNLVGVQAAESCAEASSYFAFIQNLYNFFSASPHRWNVLVSALGPTKKVIKTLSATRWSARADAVACLHDGYDQIKAAFDVFIDDEEEKHDARLAARGLRKQMNRLETVFLTILWNDILSRCNKTSTFLQHEQMNLSEAVKLIRSLISQIEAKREMFEVYEAKAKEKSGDSKQDYKDSGSRKKNRSCRIAFFDGNAPEVHLEGQQKFKVQSFLPIIDCLTSNLTKRLQAYEVIFERFGFFERIHDLEEEEIRQHCENLAAYYKSDIDTEELISDSIHLKHYIKEEIETLREMYRYKPSENQQKEREEMEYVVHDSGEKGSGYDPKRTTFNIPLLYYHLHTNTRLLLSAFPNVEIAMRIFLTMMVTNTSGERSFSKLKFIKDYRRSTMTEERLNYLSIMSIESKVLEGIDFSDIIKTFAQKKCRKANIV